jgi:hypothetical protein
MVEAVRPLRIGFASCPIALADLVAAALGGVAANLDGQEEPEKNVRCLISWFRR